jgi:hypothetical protein
MGKQRAGAMMAARAVRADGAERTGTGRQRAGAMGPMHASAWEMRRGGRRLLCCMGGEELSMLVLHGVAWCCMVLHGVAWCCMEEEELCCATVEA